MLYRVIGPVAGLSLLAGCAATHDVAQMGPDTYTVSASASPARGGASGARSMAITAAGQHCQKLGREVMVTNVSGQTTNIHGAGSVDVTFRCLAPGDPALQRPVYQRPPDVVIQNRG